MFLLFLFCRPVAASIFIDTGGSLIPLGRWKSPAAWLSDIYEPVDPETAHGFGTLPLRTWRRALSKRPRDARADEGGLNALFQRGFSGALHLGAIKMPLRPLRPNFVPSGPSIPSGLIQVALLNDGEVPWAAGAKLCNIQSNASQHVTATCLIKGQVSESCSDLPVGGMVHLFIKVPLYLSHLAVKAAWYQSRFSLCDAANQPFRILMSILTFYGEHAPVQESKKKNKKRASHLTGFLLLSFGCCAIPQNIKS